MSESSHPGYEVIKGADGWYYPVRLEGGAKPKHWDRDGKDRHLDEEPRLHAYDPRPVYEFIDAKGDVVCMDNSVHAENFLNKWVREMVGLVYAAETWLDYQEQQANHIKDLPAILDSLEAKRARYETIARAHEAAAAMVKLIDEGKMDKETARQIFVMVEGQAANPEVVELYRDLSARI